MLKDRKKSIEITSVSKVTVAEGGTEKEVAIEGYACRINSEKPQDMTISKYFTNNEAAAMYLEHRVECRADYLEFQKAAYELQDELIAERENSKEETTE